MSDFDELRKLADAATPGPWEAVEDSNYAGLPTGFWFIAPFAGPSEMSLDEKDAAFIAASREAVPALLDRLADLRARLAAAEGERLPRIDPDTDDTMGKTIPITESRLFDLVRYMRSELQDAGLITMGEWTWLATGATPDVPGAGSPSRKRLERYDELAARAESAEQALAAAQARIAEVEACVAPDGWHEALLEALGLSDPQTWDAVLGAVKQLQRGAQKAAAYWNAKASAESRLALARHEAATAVVERDEAIARLAALQAELDTHCDCRFIDGTGEVPCASHAAQAEELAAVTSECAHYKALVDADAFQQQDRAIRKTHGWKRDGRELPELVAAQAERIAALEAALKKYGRHHLDCVDAGDGTPCICGLDATITGKEGQS